MANARLWLTVGLVMLLFVGCQTITEELPTRPSPAPVVVVPVPVFPGPAATPIPTLPGPQPQPSPTPSTPVPAPQPTPTPSSTPTPVTPASCAPAPAPGNENCPRLTKSDYLPIVESAVDAVIKAHKDWFRDDGPYKMKLLVEEGVYTRALVSTINQKGACAGYYAEEVSVRRSRDFSENFDVLTANYYLWRGEGSYRSTCFPASTTSE